jgi:hypothetical protein
MTPLLSDQSGGATVQFERYRERLHHDPTILPSMSNRLALDEERLGMAWWNSMYKDERIRALRAAKHELQRCDPSIAEAWLVWKNSPIRHAERGFTCEAQSNLTSRLHP